MCHSHSRVYHRKLSCQELLKLSTLLNNISSMRASIVQLLRIAYLYILRLVGSIQDGQKNDIYKAQTRSFSPVVIGSFSIDCVYSTNSELVSS